MQILNIWILHNISYEFDCGSELTRAKRLDTCELVKIIF